jgi:hypothetical protein
VLVHDHWRQGFFDYVYNAADIDGAPIVWARDMGPEKNQELLNYYRGRKVWLLEADLKADQLRTYPAKGTNAGSKPEESPTNEE